MMTIMREAAPATGALLTRGEYDALVANNMRAYRLTGAERVVAGLLLRGMMNKDIAAALDRHDYTIKAHITHINAKMGTGDRLQIVLRLLGLY